MTWRKQVILLAKPGDTYVFSGVVTNIDLRDGTLALQNRSDDQTYELHFDQSAVDDRSKLKVGSEVTAHAVFNGKQYNANDLQLQAANADDSRSRKKSNSEEWVRPRARESSPLHVELVSFHRRITGSLRSCS